MNDTKLFVLVCIMDDALMWHWTIPAADELAAARHMLHKPWTYENAFWALRIDMRKLDELRAEELLQAIHESYTNMHTPAVLYLLPVAPP